jgi:adenylate cyclase, class 2
MSSGTDPKLNSQNNKVMQTEIEAKFLDIKTEEIRGKLKSLGAKLIHAEHLMKRKNYDFPDLRLAEKNGWIRVRDEGDKITLTYKQVDDLTIHGSKEIGIVVSDFDATCAILETLGLESKSYQETKRETWEFNGAEVTLDSWPWIPPFLEIEATDKKTVEDVAGKLGFEMKDALHGSSVTAYKHYFDLDEKIIWSQPEFRFGMPCPWMFRT